MKRLIIIGAGGFGRELFHWVRQHPDCGVEWVFAGFLDDNHLALEGYGYDPGIIGSIREYEPSQGDVLLLGIGLPKVKRTIVSHLKDRGAVFVTFIHPSAVLGGNVLIGNGSVICPGVVLSADIHIGDFVTCNYCSTVGHDVEISDYVTLCGHCDITGFCRIGEGVFFGSHACVIPKIDVGSWSVVGAGSTVTMRVSDNASVVGNPARRIPL